MAGTVEQEYAGYEAQLPWHHRQPFDGVPQFPCVIEPGDACYFSWAPVTGTGRSLLASPGDVVFLPPEREHSLQAIGARPVEALFALAL